MSPKRTGQEVNILFIILILVCFSTGIGWLVGNLFGVWEEMTGAVWGAIVGAALSFLAWLL